ncbi:MAG TPA: hypothetical protein VGI39_22090 [Polyangiaceae bacterium]|jgi:hypothetical protein
MPGVGDTEPLVRARFCQEWLELVEKEDEPWRGRFHAAVSSDLRESIVGACRVAWLPVSAHVALSDAVAQAFGVARAHDYYRRAFALSLRGPVLGPLMQTGARVLGLSPATFARWAGKAYAGGFRNAGRIEGEVLGPGRARLNYFDLPEVCTASDAWMTSPQGSAYGAYDVLGVQGVVRLDHSRRREGKMVLDLEWNER